MREETAAPPGARPRVSCRSRGYKWRRARPLKRPAEREHQAWGAHLELVASRRRRDATTHSGTVAVNNGVTCERIEADLTCEPGRLFGSVGPIESQLSLAIRDRRLNRLTDILGFHFTQSDSKVVDPHQDVSLLPHQLPPNLSRRTTAATAGLGSIAIFLLDVITRARLSTLAA